MWKKIDPALQFPPPSQLNLTVDECWYAREYKSGGGYAASAGNNLISNFKKPVSYCANANVWGHKVSAAKQFALEVSQLFGGNSFALAIIPQSKAKTDPLYDPRFDDFLRELVRLAPNVVVEEPITITHSVSSSSTQGGSRSISQIQAHYNWAGFRGNVLPSILIVIDDVITSGGHFKAYKSFVHQHHPEVRVVGLFWAMTI